MTIASAIATKQQQVADSYAAVSNKGGTLPATQNLTNLATAISSIPSGGGGGSKFGATINTFLGDVDANGVLQLPTEQSDLVFTGVKNIATNGLYYKFAYSKVKSVLFSDLEEAINSDCLLYAFYNSEIKTASFPKLTTIDYAGRMFGDSSLESVSMPYLTTVIGGSTNRGLYYAFYGTDITELDLPNLTTITGDRYGLNSFCSDCNKLETVRFTKLETIPTRSSAGFSNFYNAFNDCIALEDIYFNAVNSNTFTGGYTNVFNSMFSSTSGRTNGCTVHFPSNMQSIISGLNGYPTFGGNASYITIAFDLPATS